MKSGYVSLLGRPNSGKSTLLNRIIGKKIAITSPKAQTTRSKIIGIWHGTDAQIIFLDTPGLHEAKGTLNKRMMKAARKAGGMSDLILYVVEANMFKKFQDIENLKQIMHKNRSVILLINKIDLISKLKLLPQIEYYKNICDFKEIFPISALCGDNINNLIETICKYLPEGPEYYPKEMITDQTDRFIIAEFIREKLIGLTYQEVPHKCAASVDSMEIDQDKKVTKIHATIFVEKISQKGILIGKNGQRLKEIRHLAKREIELFLGMKVSLEIWVKVLSKWQSKESILNNFGY